MNSRWIAFVLLAGALVSADDADRPAPVPDPIGLGERLALIDWLREQGQPVQPGAALGDLRVAYWQRIEGAEREAAAQARRRAEREQLEASRRAAYDAWLRERMAQEPPPEPARDPAAGRPEMPVGGTAIDPVRTFPAEGPAAVARGPRSNSTAGAGPFAADKRMEAAHNALAVGRGATITWTKDHGDFDPAPIAIEAFGYHQIMRDRKARSEAATGEKQVRIAASVADIWKGGDRPVHIVIVAAGDGMMLACPDMAFKQTRRSWDSIRNAETYTLAIPWDSATPVRIRLIDPTGAYREWKAVFPRS